MERGEEALGRLLSNYEGRWQKRARDSFRSLVRIILSQNTSYKNEAMAYKQLEATIGITPSNLANASVEKIADAIRPAGMFNLRGRTLKALAEVIIERYGGEIGPVLEKPYVDTREELMGLPGVGPKTADVLLMFDAGKEVIPVDRHIFRITKRLRLVPEKAIYDDVRLALQKAAPSGRHIDVHILLIRFGREVCRARKPRCHECFLLDICPYPKENKAS